MTPIPSHVQAVTGKELRKMLQRWADGIDGEALYVIATMGHTTNLCHSRHLHYRLDRRDGKERS